MCNFQNIEKLGIIGGTFNPIHLGHLECSQVADDAFSFDEVWIMPAYISNFKQEQNLVSADDRLKMCQFAVEDFGNTKFKICDIEIKRQGISYTSDTLTQIKKMLPQAELYFITGSDAVFDFEDWHNYQEILDVATVVSVMRKGYYSASEKQMKFLNNHQDRIKFINAEVIECSSSDIHERIKNGQDVDKFLTHSVASYIKANKLYL